MLLTIAEMQALEIAADRAGMISLEQMMERAGQAVADEILKRIDLQITHKIVVLCGKGNNGGDGLVAAHYLTETGATVAVYGVVAPDETDGKVQRLRASNVFMVDAENDQQHRVLNHLLHSATVVVDAVFGTGVRLPLRGLAADVLKQTKTLIEKRQPRAIVVAVDCPSGLNCDTGDLDSNAISADVTVTFAAPKRGHYAFPGAEALGELIVANIGIPSDLPELANIAVQLASVEKVRAHLPARPRSAHKGTFGNAVVVAGSANYVGAAHLAGMAAYRSGSGWVTLAVPAPLQNLLAGQLPDITWLPLPHEFGAITAEAAEVLVNGLSRATALLLGPGFGLAATTGEFVEQILNQASVKKLPALIDADGLKLLTKLSDWSRRLPAHTVLTPHVGEMMALTGLSKEVIQADRIGIAQRHAVEWKTVVVLKGAFTVIAAPDGRATVEPFATAALARAGTGDVLAGIITGLMAQGVAPYEAAVLGAFIHGRAGELAASSVGLASVLASDVLGHIGQAIVALEANLQGL